MDNRHIKQPGKTLQLPFWYASTIKLYLLTMSMSLSFPNTNAATMNEGDKGAACIGAAEFHETTRARSSKE